MLPTKIPSKIDLLLSLQSTNIQDLLDRDEISSCLLTAFRQSGSSSAANCSVRRFSQKQTAREIREFLHQRMNQLLRLEFRKQQEAVSAILAKKDPRLLHFLETIPPFPANTSWSDFERAAVQKILLFFSDINRPLPAALRHIDQHLPSFDPTLCMVCCTGRYVLQDSEGFLVCTNLQCRHQTANLVESRITYGTGYSNELSWTQNKSVTLHEPLPAVSLFLAQEAVSADASLSSSSATATATAAAASAASALRGCPTGIFAPLPSLPGSPGFPNASHERWLHFCESLDAFRGIFTECLSREVVESVIDHLAKQHQVLLIKDLHVTLVRDALKQILGNAIQPGQIHFVMHVMGFQFPHLSIEEFELASFLFQRFEILWPVFAASAASCCFSHSFVLSRIMHLLHREDIAAFFPYAKEGVRNETFTRVFQQIVDMLHEKTTFYSNLPLLT